MTNPSVVTYGPGYIIDGPVPQKPAYTLLDAANLVVESDDHWMNGLAVRPYPPDTPHAFDYCNQPSLGKATGSIIPQPDFSAFTILLAETCSAYLGSQSDFAARAELALNAVQAYAVEYEFYSGATMTHNPALVSKIDSTGHVFTGGGTDITVFPAASTVQKPEDALGYLENAIALTGRAGMIHCSPAMVIALMGHFQVRQVGKLLQTTNGTTVVPGYGYVGANNDGFGPVGKTAATPPKQEWMFATGPVEIRQSDPFINPDQLWMALDRTNNVVTYRAERYFAYDWDATFKAAVLADWTT